MKEKNNEIFSRNQIAKLGSLSSKIEKKEGYFYKEYILEKSNLTKNLNEIILNFDNENNNSLEYPKSIKTSEYGENYIKVSIKQKELFPFLDKNSITSMHLYDLGYLILKQQKYLINRNLSFYDARPDNYWLNKNNNKLVDIGSIQVLSLQNLYSFEEDFINHFIYPLLIEKSNNIPVSAFFKANMYKYKINIMNNIKTYKSISLLKFAISKNIKDIINIFISNANTSFVSFLNDFKNENNDFENIKRNGLKINKYLLKLLKTLKPKIKESQWTNYTQFHEPEYNKNKKEIFKKFTEKYSHNGIVDLGSNLTLLNEKSIEYRVDNDTSICNEIYINQPENNFVSLIDISDALLGKSSDYLSMLNPNKKYSSAIMISIIHHLIIGDGINPNIVFLNLSKLYKYILLEYPLSDDPMVRLLSRKRNEFINWGWENNHEIEAKKYFEITEYKKLSTTRRIFMLQAK